jgi:hypothetical protein
MIASLCNDLLDPVLFAEIVPADKVDLKPFFAATFSALRRTSSLSGSANFV